MNQGNVDAFQFVQLYNNENINYVNYEHLFCTYDLSNADVNSAPASNSLFNMQNMMDLVELGMSTPNIVGADKDMTYGIDFGLNDDWYAMALRL